MGLSIPVGTGGSVYPAFREESGTYRLLGRPCVITDKLKALGTKGDLMLVDLSQYAVALRKDMRLDSSSHLRFNQDKVDWRMILRIDGAPLWDTYYKDADGREYAPFVVLADRS